MNSNSEISPPPQRFLSIYWPFLVNAFPAIVYGYLCVVLFGVLDTGQPTPFSLESFSWSFIMLVPYTIGIVSVSPFFRKFLTNEPDLSLVLSLLFPWVGIIGVAILAIIASFGLLFCFVISIPILFPAASFGGLSVYLVQQNKKAALTILILGLLLPFGLSPVEAQVEKDQHLVETLTSIHIQADPATIWAEIGEVDPIGLDEHQLSWVYMIGVPRPLEATVSHHGVGGVRYAAYENGLRFEEEILEWEVNRRLRFTIDEASGIFLPAPLDMIDGETFDVLEGTYEIELLEDGSVMLHLSSKHQLTSRFNTYGAFWTDQLMRSLQNNILEIIKARAEAA